MPEKELEFPTEIIFKAVFYYAPQTKEAIKQILREKEINEFDISEKSSSTGKFNSYTIKATFPSDEILNEICTLIQCLPGHKMLF